MSTEICKNNAKICGNEQVDVQSLVIKGFRNQPVVLKFVKKNEKSTTVLCRDGKTQMDFANDVVYQCDDELYQKLQNAYKMDDKKGLEQLWQQAKSITLS